MHFSSALTKLKQDNFLIRKYWWKEKKYIYQVVYEGEDNALILFNVDGKDQMGLSLSHSDIMANDWEIVDPLIDFKPAALKKRLKRHLEYWEK
jgi:carbamoylphosphate synthase large subunit